MGLRRESRGPRLLPHAWQRHCQPTERDRCILARPDDHLLSCWCWHLQGL